MTGIIIAVIIVAAIGLIAGIVLSVASVVFEVPVDKKQAQIRECLPGANCGACGFSGCDGYASALSKGTAVTGLCTPGGKGVADQISEILGTEKVDVKAAVAFVKCNGNCDVTEKRGIYEGDHTCAGALQILKGNGSCEFSCIGFGDCMNVCEYDAIKICNGVAVVSPELCKSCGMCVKTCPKGIIHFITPDTAAVRCSSTDKGAVTRKNCKAGCIGCMMCQKSCENGAVIVMNNLAEVNSNCTACGKCVEACKMNCISLITKGN